MDYFDLINKFAFPPEIYLAVFLVIGVVINFGIFTYFAIHWLIRKKWPMEHHHPKFRIWVPIKLIAQPGFIGTVYAALPVYAVITVVWFVISQDTKDGGLRLLDKISSVYDLPEGMKIFLSLLEVLFDEALS